jgi:hypothetical protein
MHEEPTAVIIQRYLDALPGGAAAEPLVRELLEPCAHRSESPTWVRDRPLGAEDTSTGESDGR